MDLVIFDLETTGLSPSLDEIIQIAGIRLRAGVICPDDSFSTFVNPGRRISPFITSYTGIGDAHVRDAPDAASALKGFSRFAGDAVLVAHNGHRFDMPFIHATCGRHLLTTREVRYVDSLALSRRVWRGIRGHGLDSVIDRLGLDRMAHRRHDARGDVSLLAEAVVRMWRQVEPACGSMPVQVHAGRLPEA